MDTPGPQLSSPIGLIAAGGAMPFAVADSLVARGINPVVFALKGACDPVQAERFHFDLGLRGTNTNYRICE